jgi:hypothetical protein
MADLQEFQRANGSLLHLNQSTRPVIVLPIESLAGHQVAPTAAHHAVLLDIVRFVGGTSARGITQGLHTAALGFLV